MDSGAFQRVELYCFSGTGNALRASQWMAERAEATGAEARLVRVEPDVRVVLPEGSGRTLLGFLYSTHGFCAPWSMLRLLWRVPSSRGRGSATDAFLLNTRGGFKIGPLLVPGVSGVALLLPLLMLLLKGYRVVGTRPLDMPMSWLQILPGLKDATAEYISARRREEAVAFFDRLLAGGRAFHGFWTLPLDLAVATITPIYLAAGRFGLAKLNVASPACDGCGVCAQLCPTRAIRMVRGRPFWTFDCESCMRCYSVCPKKAVQCSHPFLALQLGLLALVGAPLAWLGARVAEASTPALGTAARWAVAWAGFMLLFFLGYRLFDLLMRVRGVSWLLSRASFNHYWRRYLAPGIRVKDLRGPRPE